MRPCPNIVHVILTCPVEKWDFGGRLLKSMNPVTRALQTIAAIQSETREAGKFSFTRSVRVEKDYLLLKRAPVVRIEPGADRRHDRQAGRKSLHRLPGPLLPQHLNP